MASDERKIVIVLKSETEGATTGEKNEVSKADNPELEKNSSTSNAIAAFAAKQLVATTISEVSNWAMYEWNKNLNLNDDYIGQRNKQIAMQCIAKTAGAANTIFNSAAMGAMVGGPWGAAIGAAIGATQVVTSTIRENLQAEEQQRIQLAKMDAQLDFTRKRAGWSTTAASIGEDL